MDAKPTIRIHPMYVGMMAFVDVITTLLMGMEGAIELNPVVASLLHNGMQGFLLWYSMKVAFVILASSIRFNKSRKLDMGIMVAIMAVATLPVAFNTITMAYYVMM